MPLGTFGLCTEGAISGAFSFVFDHPYPGTGERVGIDVHLSNRILPIRFVLNEKVGNRKRRYIN